MRARRSSAVAATSLALAVFVGCSTSDTQPTPSSSDAGAEAGTEPLDGAGPVEAAGQDGAPLDAPCDGAQDASADVSVRPVDAAVDAEADASAGCGLAAVWLPSPLGVVAPNGRDPTVIFASGGPERSYYRLTFSTETDSEALPQPQHLYLEHGTLDVSTGAERDRGYVELGGCFTFPMRAAPACTAVRVIHSKGDPAFGTANGHPPALLTNGALDADFVLVAFYETLEPPDGHSTFALVSIDPASGSVVKSAIPPSPDPPESVVFVTSAKRLGDDVHVFGFSGGSFAGETGAGAYFELVYPGFLGRTCTLVDSRASSITRGRVPLGG